MKPLQKIEVPRVELYLRARPDGTKYYQVKVGSAVKVGLRKIGIWECSGATMVKDAGDVGKLAGALAELLCMQYQDTIDPVMVAQQCEQLHHRMVLENPALLIGFEAPRHADGIFTKH